MTNIDKNEVRRLAQLSSISLNDKQIEDLQKDIGNILNYVEQLQQIDTSDIEPSYQVTHLSNVGREDVVINYGLSREQLLNSAPDQQDGHIKVPKVL